MSECVFWRVEAMIDADINGFGFTPSEPPDNPHEPCGECDTCARDDEDE